MKRSIGCLSLLALATGAFAQANFTIVRPVDNARVREKVKIQFPKGSVPAGGYVGIFLNGQLIDAVVPQNSGKYSQYILDTKGRALPDSPSGKPDHLEAKLFVDYNGQPRIVRTSSIDLNIANTASIRVPNSGFKLRYRFQPGTELVYRLTLRSAIDTISEEENKRGGRPAELPLDSETVRMKYAVDNSYPDGSGLLRMQAMPTKGKDYAILTAKASEGPKKYSSTDMAAIYMRLTPTGREIFGSIPSYWDLEGTSGGGNRFSLFAAFPLPSLPEKSVKPGDSWQTRFQNGKIDMEKLYGQTSVIQGFGPARGEFVNVEWEMGHPCAKIKNTITGGQMSAADRKLVASGAQMAGDKISLNETIWFALDTRQVLKVLRDTTIETKQEATGGSGMFGGPGGGAPSGSGGYPGGGPGRMGGPSRGGAGGGKADVTGPATGDLRQSGSSMGPGGRMGGRPGGGMQGPGGGYPGGGRTGAGGRGGESQGGATYIRIRQQQIFVLEQ